MPTYVYEVITEDGSVGESFEIEQRISDPPLATHPATGKPVRRIIAPTAIITKFGIGSSIKDGALKRGGFTKYVKNADGEYRKAFGQGPTRLRR